MVPFEDHVARTGRLHMRGPLSPFQRGLSQTGIVLLLIFQPSILALAAYSHSAGPALPIRVLLTSFKRSEETSVMAPERASQDTIGAKVQLSKKDDESTVPEEQVSTSAGY